MEKDYSKDMDANLKRRQEIYEEIENLTFDPSLPVLESYQDYCKRYAQLRDEMLQLHSLLPKETRLQCMRRTTNQWARQNGALWMFWVGFIAGFFAIISGINELSGTYPELGVVYIIIGLPIAVVHLWILTYQSRT